MPGSDYCLEVLSQATGQVMREFADAADDGISSVRREVELLRRELTVLREEIGLERGLKDLRRDVAKA
jgi:hypothetical protein